MQVWRELTKQWQATQGGSGAPPDMLKEKVVHGDIARLRTGFNSIDKNRSGTLSTRELAAVMKAMGTRATIEELEDMVSDISDRCAGPL